METHSQSSRSSAPGPAAVCLVSGGMDSAVVLAEAKERGFTPYALSFRYGQRHDVELVAAERVAQALGARDHRTVTVDLSALGGSALTDDIDVPKDRGAEAIGTGVPATYVPARNTIFLSVALGWAEVLGATDLFVGVNAVDYSGYPDCRPEFIAAFERLADLATAAGAEEGARFTVHAPLMELSKAGIVHRARELGVDLGLTHTCYDPVTQRDGGVVACGRCDACALRLAGFAEAGEIDPVPYADSVQRGSGERPASALDGVVRDASALVRARETCRRAVRAGFHWKEARGALGKLEEELDELREVLPLEVLKGAMKGSPNPIPEGKARERIESELGDVLMAAAFLGGYLGLDPEVHCHRALERFDARFRIMEEDLGGAFTSSTMDEMLVAWTRAKRLLDPSRNESE